ncbi:MAG: STAS domain-containing protein [Oscillospiraceae bacterium]|nr:STAS domain-containing protein [Oscillospiraceae bacterium]
MSLGLYLKESVEEGFVSIELSGEVDIYTCQMLKDRLYKIIDESGKDIILDCSQLNYIDSMGLGVFVAVLKKIKLIDRDIKIINLKESIRKLFVITSLDALFNIK